LENHVIVADFDCLGKTQQLGAGEELLAKEGVIQLQKQLRAFAFYRQNPAIDPQRYDGTMTTGTLVALFNATLEAGSAIPGVGAVTSAIGNIKGMIEGIPYAGTVVQFLLSPWIVDPVINIIFAILGIIPGVSSGVTAAKAALNAAKAAIAAGAGPIALAVYGARSALPQVASGLGGANSGGLTLYDPRVHGRLQSNPRPDLSRVLKHYGLSGSITVSATPATPSPCGTAPAGGFNYCTIPQTGKPYWTKITIPQWFARTRSTSYVGTAPSEWAAFDVANRNERLAQAKSAVTRRQAFYAQQDAMRPSGMPVSNAEKSQRANFLAFLAKIESYVRDGTSPFETFEVGGKKWSAYYKESTKTLTIKPYAPPDPTLLEVIADKIVDVLDWVAESAEDVYDLVTTYGCMLVNNDIVVAAVSVGVGIVATPAASAAVAGAAATGKAACAALKVGEALYMIIKLFATDTGQPYDLVDEGPPAAATSPVPVPGIKTSLIAAAGGSRLAKATALTTGKTGLAVDSATSRVIIQDPRLGKKSTVLLPNATTAATEPVYKKWWFWLIVGGAVIGGAAVYVRRKRPSAA
jgi:hypothetical protein